MHTIYSYSGSDFAEFRRTYAEVVRQEYYEGDLEMEVRPFIDLTVQKSLAHPLSLVRIISNSGISFRRSWHHIRDNKTGVRVIWFIRRGSLQITRSRNTCTVEAGECAILDSNTPFHACAQTDGEHFDAVQAIVPAHLFLSHLATASGFDASFAVNFDNQEIVVKLLDLLLGDGDALSVNAAEPLAAAFLEAIADRVGNLVDTAPRRQRVIDVRLADIKAYIMKNLTDPDLTYDEVAAKCGISPRYLCYLLKSDDTSFSKLLWSQRLPKAREWLVLPEFKDYPIQEIAFMSGFKSAAHFSRMFKSAYGCAPKEYRAKFESDAQGMTAAAGSLPPLDGELLFDRAA